MVLSIMKVNKTYIKLENTEEVITNGQPNEPDNIGYTRRRKTKQKTKTQHNMCWTPLDANRHK